VKICSRRLIWTTSIMLVISFSASMGVTADDNGTLNNNGLLNNDGTLYNFDTLNSDGRGPINESQIWGKTADWCDYDGIINQRQVGVTLIADPQNFRPSWFHARDYGLLLANAFGR